jgi:hypothetical protein
MCVVIFDYNEEETSFQEGSLRCGLLFRAPCSSPMHRPRETVARDHWMNRMIEGVAGLARIQRGWNEHVYDVLLDVSSVCSPGPNIDIDVSVDDESVDDRSFAR